MHFVCALHCLSAPRWKTLPFGVFFHFKCEHRFKHNLLHADTDDISCVSIVVWPGMISLLVSHGLIMISLNIFNEILCSLHRFIQKYPTLNTEGQLWRKSDTVRFPSYFHKCALQQDIRTENTMQILPHPQKTITLDVSNGVNIGFPWISPDAAGIGLILAQYDALNFVAHSIVSYKISYFKHWREIVKKL